MGVLLVTVVASMAALGAFLPGYNFGYDLTVASYLCNMIMISDNELCSGRSAVLQTVCRIILVFWNILVSLLRILICWVMGPVMAVLRPLSLGNKLN